MFGEFLYYNNQIGFFRRSEPLFKDVRNIHLNRVGNGMLARSYLKVIHNSFNPMGY